MTDARSPPPISAEYGRFTGGVVNAVTKSGGNTFSGSFRSTFNNDSWRTTSPFDEPKTDATVPTYEATLGGPIFRDRTWFFGAGRMFDQNVSAQTGYTNLPAPDVQSGRTLGQEQRPGRHRPDGREGQSTGTSTTSTRSALTRPPAR